MLIVESAVIERINTGPPVAVSTYRAMTWASFPEIILSLMHDGEGLADSETDNLDTSGFDPKPASSPASSLMTSIWTRLSSNLTAAPLSWQDPPYNQWSLVWENDPVLGEAL